MEVEPVVSAQSVDNFDKEVGVFEIDEQSDVEDDAKCEQATSGRSFFAASDSFADQEVGNGDGDQQQEEESAGFVVEVEGEERDIDDAQQHGPSHELVEEGETQKQEQEKSTAEDQRRFGIVLQQVQCFVYDITQFVHNLHGWSNLPLFLPFLRG